jgi:septum formation protein
MNEGGFYLCSSSPRRHQLLKQANISFSVIPNQLENEPAPHQFESPIRYASRLARLKCIASKRGYKGVVMGVDTVVSFKGTFLGKPGDSVKALSILKRLNGQSHVVTTACALFDTHQNRLRYCIDQAHVNFNHVSVSQLQSYITNFEPYDKAGAYGIQDNPSFLKGYEGDFYTIMGLPINRLLKLLSAYGIVKS